MAELYTLCTRCKCVRPAQPLVLRQVAGFILFSVTTQYTGNMCWECGRRLYSRTMGITAFLGMLSFPGWLSAPIAAVRNSNAYDKFKRAHQAQGIREYPDIDTKVLRDHGTHVIALEPHETEYPLNYLPWPHEFDSRILMPVKEYKAQLPRLIWIFSLLGLIACLALGANAAVPDNNTNDRRRSTSMIQESRQTRLRYLWGGAGCALAGVLSYRWYLVRKRGRGEEDILCKVLPDEVIFQSGRVHLAALGIRRGDWIRVLVIAQNQFDQPSHVNLQLSGDGVRSLHQIKLGPLAVAHAMTDLPLGRVASQGHNRLDLSVLTDGQGGRRKRLFARPTLRNQSRDLQKDDPALKMNDVQIQQYFTLPVPGGIQFFKRDGTWTAARDWPDPDSIGCFSGQWITVPLWDLAKPRRSDLVARRIVHAINSTDGSTLPPRRTPPQGQSSPTVS